MMPQRRQMIAPQGLDIQPMQPMAPMQFAVPQTNAGGGGMDMLMKLAQQYRTGQDAKAAEAASLLHSKETDAPLQRRKLPFNELAAMAGMANA